jgi:teichuronic acid exporter
MLLKTMQMQAKKQRLAYWKDVLFQASGNSIAQFIGILGLPVLTRLYTPESFADQAVFIQITTLLVAFVTFRYEYFVPLLKSKEESLVLSHWVIKIGLLMSVSATFVIVVLDWMDFFISTDLKVGYYYYLAPITAYLISLSFLYQHEAQRVRDYKQSALAEVVSKSAYVISGTIGSFFSSGVGLILTSAFGALGKILVLRKYASSPSRGTKQEIRFDLIKLYRSRAVGMILANTMLTFSGLIPLYLISSMYGAVTLGQFSLVMTTIFLPSGLIGSAVGNVFYQRAGVFYNERELESLKNLWSETIIRLMVFALPVYIFAFYVSPWVYPFVFGDAWVEAGQYAQIMSVAAFFSFIAGPVDRLSLVLGLAYYLPIIHMLRLTLIMALAIITIKHGYTAADYIAGYSIVMAAIYILDLAACRYMLNVREGGSGQA